MSHARIEKTPARMSTDYISIELWKRDAYLLPRRVEHICPPVGCNFYECADSTFRRLKFCNFPGVNSTQSLNSWSRGAWNLERHLRSLSSSLQVGPSWINLAITTVSRDLRTMWLPRLRLVQRVGPPSWRESSQRLRRLNWSGTMPCQTWTISIY